MTIFETGSVLGCGGGDEVVAASIAVPEVELPYLRRRLVETRWPDRVTVDDWSPGAPLHQVSALCEAATIGGAAKRC